ncbi:MAG: type I restriction enzyme HsdR N-terminal domain-containing protein [Acetobacter sp.]|nr:type I restriction enzyme HsdR N-terminal domain-containing protein [Acetobacter sp.]
MSNDTTDDFRQKLKNFAEHVQKQASHCSNEEATKQFLILPLFDLLGYDTRNPHEFAPECISDPSGKNRVDYAILRNGKPVIALECKPYCCSHKDFVVGRGQLTGYYNSTVTIKIGILTDGMIYEFYVDSDNLNIMDSEAFLTLNLNDIVQGEHIEESVLKMLQSFQKSTFEPEKLRTEAVKRRFIQKVVQQIEELFQEPSEEFVRLLVREQKNGKEPTEEEVKEACLWVEEALDIVLPQLAKASLVSGNSEEDEVNLDSVEEDTELKDVRVNGRFFSSTRVAFRENGLPDSKHQEFRKELKKEGFRVYEKANGEKLCFETSEAIALKRLVSQGLCSVGTLVFDKDHCYQAKITDRGTLQTLDEQEGVPSSLAGKLLKKTSYGIRNAWDFWRVNYEGQEISLSDLRAIAAERLKKI